MKKLLFVILLLAANVSVMAQLNFQMHYDFGHALYGSQLSNRSDWTATIENFTADRWGSTYFFVDGTFGSKTMTSAYAELSRELRFWDLPISAHVEYNGGLSGDPSVNGKMVLGSEPQFWINLAALDKVSDDCKLSLGTELEISNNLVWPTDGINNRFYAIPTLAAKWTF